MRYLILLFSPRYSALLCNEYLTSALIFFGVQLPRSEVWRGHCMHQRG